MDRMFLRLLFVSFWIASPAHALPLTWHWFGTTSSSSQFNAMSIPGLDYELRVFLDTDLVGFDPPSLSDIIFNGPHQAEIEIATVGVLPVNMIPWVEYFAPNDLVTGVTLRTPFFQGIMFPSSITSDFLHLTPIPLTATSSGGLSGANPLLGPNGLTVSGPVHTFAATVSATTVPEGASTALLLAVGVSGLGFLRRRRRKAAG
jgi:hypothetical protein